MVSTNNNLNKIKDFGYKWVHDYILVSPDTKTKPGSIAYLLYGEKTSSQSINIKFGKFGEVITKEMIKVNPELELLNCGIQVIDKKQKKDIDLIWLNKITNTIYIRELKGNIELDTEKLPATFSKLINEFMLYARDKYPSCMIDIGILHWSVYNREELSKGLHQIKKCENNGVQVNHWVDFCNLINFNWDKDDYYEYMRNFGKMIDKLNYKSYENNIPENILENNNIPENIPENMSKNIIPENNNIDYSKKTRTELISICKEHKIKGYSNKKKEDIIFLLQSNSEPINQPINQPTIIVNPLKPLVKWSGGKGDEIKKFQKYIPNYDIYIEPFIGGGALFFNLAPKKAIICDVHTELIDLYTNIGQGKAIEIYNFMEQTPNDEQTYYKIRDEMVINDSLDNAKRFYYQRKTCFRGMLRYNKNGKFNIPFGKYKTINYSELKNKEYEILLSRTLVLCKSFEYVFENYNNENNFMFLDPPYDSEFTDYGYCQFGKKEHEKLAKYFKETKIKCLMVIGKTKFIEELYKDFIVDEYDKNYKFKLYDGRVGDEINTKHLVIKNY